MESQEQNIFSTLLLSESPTRKYGTGENSFTVRDYVASINATLLQNSFPTYFTKHQVGYRITTTLQRTEACMNGISCEDASTCGFYSDTHFVALQQVASAKLLRDRSLKHGPFDFTAICRRLGQFVATISSGLYPTLNINWLLGHSTPCVFDVADWTGAGVYVPIHQTIGDLHVTATILYAARGCMSNAYTDRKGISNGFWKHPLPKGLNAAECAMRAVKVVIDQASLSDVGGLHLAYFLFGIHDVVTVEAHTDDGGLLLDIIRRIPTVLPIGMIGAAPQRGMAFPWGLAERVPWGKSSRPQNVYPEAVDTFALVSAALFAVCDPGCGPERDIPTPCLRRRGMPWLAHEDQMTKVAGQLFRSWVRRLSAGINTRNSYEYWAEVLGMHGTERLFRSAETHPANHRAIYIPFWIEPSPLLGDAPRSVVDNNVCKVIPVHDYDYLPFFGSTAHFRTIEGWTAAAFVWRKPRECGWYYLNPYDICAGGRVPEIFITKSRDTMGVTDGGGALRQSVLFPGERASAPENSIQAFAWSSESTMVPPPHMAAPGPGGIATVAKWCTYESDSDGEQICRKLPIENGVVQVTATLPIPGLYKVESKAKRSYAGTMGLHEAVVAAFTTGDTSISSEPNYSFKWVGLDAIILAPTELTRTPEVEDVATAGSIITKTALQDREAFRLDSDLCSSSSALSSESSEFFFTDTEGSENTDTDESSTSTR